MLSQHRRRRRVVITCLFCLTLGTLPGSRTIRPRHGSISGDIKDLLWQVGHTPCERSYPHRPRLSTEVAVLVAITYRFSPDLLDFGTNPTVPVETRRLPARPGRARASDQRCPLRTRLRCSGRIMPGSFRPSSCELAGPGQRDVVRGRAPPAADLGGHL